MSLTSILESAERIRYHYKEKEPYSGIFIFYIKMMGEERLEVMKDIIIEVLASVLLAMSIYAVKKGSEYLKEKMEEAKVKAQKEEKEALAATFDTADKILTAVVGTVVASIEQTTAKDIREAVKAGIKDRNELTILASDAYYAIVDQVKPEIMEYLKSYVTDVEKYIKDMIESELLVIKNQTPAALEGILLGIDNSGMKAEEEDE